MRAGFYPYSCALSHKHKQSSLYYFLACAAPSSPCHLQSPVLLCSQRSGSGREWGCLPWPERGHRESTPQRAEGVPHQRSICGGSGTLTKCVHGYDYIQSLRGPCVVGRVHNYSSVMKEKMRHKDGGHSSFCSSRLFPMLLCLALCPGWLTSKDTII